MSKELKLLLIAFGLILVSIFVFWLQSRNCSQVEYQDLNGSHTIQVCKGENGNE
jgi:hypothetical protein